MDNCGRHHVHPDEPLLGLDCNRTPDDRVRSPRTSGFVERMNRILLDECFRVAGRTTWCTTVDAIQADLDRFLAHDNHERPHSGYRLQGRTLARALCEALGLETLPGIAAPSDQDVLAA